MKKYLFFFFILFSAYAHVNAQTILNGNHTVKGDLYVGSPELKDSNGVNKKLYFSSSTDNSTPLAIFRRNVSSSATDLVTIIGTTSSNSNRFVVGTNISGGINNLFTVTAAGNVGIGTSSPQYRLHVSGLAYFTSMQASSLSVSNLTTLNKLAVSTLYGTASDKTVKIETSSGYINLGPKNTAFAHIETDRPTFHFNRPIQVQGTISSYNGTNLSLCAGSTTPRITVLNSNGNVGIGKTNPTSLLDVNGKITVLGLDISDKTANQTKAVLARLEEGSNTSLSVKAYNTQPTKCKMFAIEHYFGNRINSAINFHRGGAYTGGHIEFLVHDGLKIATLNQAGLDVDGIIRAKEVKIESTIWADYVFAEDYNLPSLTEVKEHIEANKHLPGIPSQSEVTSEGVNLGDMQVLLLQKIEELTLYTIQQQEMIEALKKEVSELKNK